MVKKGIFSKVNIVVFMALFLVMTTGHLALAATYDLTGSWITNWTETFENCGKPLTSGTGTLTAQQTVNSWSATDESGETNSGSVVGASYTGSGSRPSGNIGTATGIVRKDTSVSFSLVRADHGSGTYTEFYYNSPTATTEVCRIDSSFILNKFSTATIPATIISNPQVLRTTTTNIVNLVSKRIQNTIGRSVRHMKTTPVPVTSGIAPATTPTNSEYGLSAKDDISNQFQAVQMDISTNNLGLSAGSPDQSMGAWGNIALSFSDNDLAATASEIDINTYIVGFDYTLSENIVMGLAIAYDNTDATNTYNTGSLDADSYSLVPYISYLINDSLSLEALYGHSWVDTDQTRSGTISSSTKSRKDFLSTSLNAYKSLRDINCTGNISYTWAKEVTEGFTESNSNPVASQRTKFSQFGLGLELSYLINQFEPYINVAYENDVTHTDILGVAYDTEGGNFGGGVRMELMDSLSGDLDYNQTMNRDNLDQYTISANVRYAF